MFKSAYTTLLLAALCSAQPRFYNDVDSSDDDVYNKKYVFAAAESCGVDTAADVISVVRFRGYQFMREFPFTGHYHILRTQRVDAQWENERLVMHACFDDEFDTVFVVDTFPEWAPKVKGFKHENEALAVYNCCRRFAKTFDPQRRMTLLEKRKKNLYRMLLYKDYTGYEVLFTIEHGDVVVRDTAQFIY